MSKHNFLRVSVGVAIAVLIPASTNAALLLSEIHYNGPTAGADPDEFVELANTGPDPLSIGSFSFARGINLVFPEDTIVAAHSTLVLARDTAGFRNRFPAFTGPLFDFSGSLSNSGEAITLQDSLNRELWTLSYDDSGEWPGSADGLGDSLQLLTGSGDWTSPASWIAATPTPGIWSGLVTPLDPSTTLPQPAPLLLVALGLIGIRVSRGIAVAKNDRRS